MLNEMRAAGVILDYALFGAVAQMRYTEPVATLDADVLVAVPSPEGLDILLEAGSVRPQEIASLAAQHGLADAWKRFEARFLND